MQEIEEGQELIEQLQREHDSLLKKWSIKLMDLLETSLSRIGRAFSIDKILPKKDMHVMRPFSATVSKAYQEP